MATNNVNPFPTTGYMGKDFFCDRENELKTLKEQVENKINTTLISLRRLGKSSVIESGTMATFDSNRKRRKSASASIQSIHTKTQDRHTGQLETGFRCFIGERNDLPGRGHSKLLVSGI